MTTLQFPAPTEPKHGPDRHLTMPSIKVEDLWRREHGSDLPTDWRHEHRLFDPDETTVLDLITHQHTPTEPPRLYGIRARFERLIARFRPAPPPPTMCEETLAVPTHGDIVALINAAGARGIRWIVEPDCQLGQCQWCREDGHPAYMRVIGHGDTPVCPECAPSAVHWDSTSDDLVIELPAHAAYVIDDAREDGVITR